MQSCGGGWEVWVGDGQGDRGKQTGLVTVKGSEGQDVGVGVRGHQGI